MSRRYSVEAYIGFNSSWTDDKKRPGAISLITIDADNRYFFAAPVLIGFEGAAKFITEVASQAAYTLVAIDQPTVVPNLTGCRPVERVAGSVVNAIGGGVQPANRTKAAMFGDRAPIWQLLDRLGTRQNPLAAYSASSGAFLIEVFPALALAAIALETWERRRAAKYNPKNKLFDISDWRLVARAVARAAAELGVPELDNHASQTADFPKPSKGDQDRLDSLICLLVALQWRRFGLDRLAVIGDGRQGYIVTPVTELTREVLARSAAKRGVPMDGDWADDANHKASLAGRD